MDEYLNVLTYPTFQLTKLEIHRLLFQEILPFLEVISVKPGNASIADDPADDKFLWCAMSGRAEAVISRDNHLFFLENPPVPICSVQVFLQQFSEP